MRYDWPFPADMSLAPGTGLGAYEIIAALGAGGMGEVYRARDTRLNRDVALKILPIWGIDDPDFRARFKREAQALAALNSPHIAAIHDVIDFDGHQAIIMELVLGTTLLEVIARGPVPVRLAIGYAIDISEALRVAHGASIVHRDLKPANVVVTESGFAKVLDFGIAKLVVDEATATDRGTMTAVTEDHAVIGTIGYMSPEQAEGRPLDGRSDIFCLGVVLHEMISGRRAFEGDSTAALLSAVLRDEPTRLRTLAPSTPRSVERCVTRCLEKDPRRRYQHAADVKAALEDIREDLGAASPDRRWPRRLHVEDRRDDPDPSAADAGVCCGGSDGCVRPVQRRRLPVAGRSPDLPAFHYRDRIGRCAGVGAGRQNARVRGMD